MQVGPEDAHRRPTPGKAVARGQTPQGGREGLFDRARHSDQGPRALARQALVWEVAIGQRRTFCNTPDASTHFVATYAVEPRVGLRSGAFP